jgi:hypothetical protein
LEQADFGKSRKDHNKICNEKLIEHLSILEDEGIQFSPLIKNKELIERIMANMYRRPGRHIFTWEHCSSTTTNGRLGVMRLVLSEQHDKYTNNPYWKTLHPDYRDRGGYHEWAVPNGAPVELSKTTKRISRDIDYQQIPIEHLPAHFKHAIVANEYSRFAQLLNRAKQAGLSNSQLHDIFTSSNIFRVKSDTSTLMHLAARNGNMSIIEAILDIIPDKQQQLAKQNNCGNTPAHIAAENNRYLLLKKLSELKVDFTIKNAKQKTAYEIAVERKSTLCLPYCAPSAESANNESGQEKEELTTQTQEREELSKVQTPFRDPAFTFASLARKTSKSAPGVCHKSTTEQSTNHQHHVKPELNRITFKDLLKKQFGEKSAARFDKSAKNLEHSGSRLQKPATESKYTFNDLLKKQFGEKTANHFIQKVLVRKAQNRAASSTPQVVSNKTLPQRDQKSANVRTFLTFFKKSFSPNQKVVRNDSEHIKQLARQRALQKAQEQQAQQREQEQHAQQKAQQRTKQPPQHQPKPQHSAVQQQSQRSSQQSQAPHRSYKSIQQHLPQCLQKQQAQQRAQQAQSKSPQHKAPQRLPQQQSQPRGQQQIQRRVQQVQQRAQQQTQQRVLQQTQQRAPQQAQQRVQQQVQQRAPQQAQQQAQQRAQQQAQQRAQQQAQQRAQQQAKDQAIVGEVVELVHYCGN